VFRQSVAGCKDEAGGSLLFPALPQELQTRRKLYWQHAALPLIAESGR
jgi:hypothetical protein